MKKKRIAAVILTAVMSLSMYTISMAGWVQSGNTWTYETDQEKAYYCMGTWVQDENGMKFQNPDGSWRSGEWFVDMDGNWCYMKEDGYIHDNQSWYYDPVTTCYIYNAQTDVSMESGRNIGNVNGNTIPIRGMNIVASLKGAADPATLNEAELPIFQRVNELINEYGLSSQGTEYERARKAYDCIENIAVYKEDESGDASLDEYSPYGIFVNGRGTCEGFARSYKILANYMDLSCKNKSSVSHMWNEVLVDGDWKYIDTSSGGSAESYLDCYTFTCPVCSTQHYFGAREGSWYCPNCKIRYENERLKW